MDSRPPSTRVGADILREQSILDQDFLSDGNFTFGGRFSGDNLADFMIGKPSAFSQITVLYNSLIRNLYGTYVQDTFRVNSHLTLNLGVRWNPFIPFTDISRGKSHNGTNPPIKRTFIRHGSRICLRVS